MRSVHVTSLDGPKAVQLLDLPEPTGDGQVLVDVHAVRVPGRLAIEAHAKWDRQGRNPERRSKGWFFPL